MLHSNIVYHKTVRDIDNLCIHVIIDAGRVVIYYKYTDLIYHVQHNEYKYYQEILLVAYWVVVTMIVKDYTNSLTDSMFSGPKSPKNSGSVYSLSFR